MKTTLRDNSLRPRYDSDINRVLRDIERWVAEAKVAANVAAGFGFDSDGFSKNEADDIREKWAMDRLCDALLDKGALVPVSKKQGNPFLIPSAC
jgi:ribosomal biogenesis protein LAS1